jgi:hypothetical protein
LTRDPDLMPPPRPSPPFFAGEDWASRGSTFLDLAWEQVESAESYELKIESHQGTQTTPVMGTNKRVEELPSNTPFEAFILAVNEEGRSPWSLPLASCTRPPKPPPPAQGFGDMIHVPTVISVNWDLRAFVEDIFNGRELLVNLGYKTIEGQVTPLRGSLGLFHMDEVSNDPNYRSLYLQLVGRNRYAPDGLNISEWSTELVISDRYFAKLELPGASSSNQILIRQIRRYYE